MQRFSNLRAYNRLRELAEDPVDLTKEGVMTPKRMESMTVYSSGLKLLYATERVTEITLQALFELADEVSALKMMQNMQAGETVNCISGVASENRAALHTAMRDFFESPNSSPKAQEVTKLAYQELEKLKNFLTSIDKNNKFTDLVQIGIGGSELGPKAIYLALRAFQKPGRRVHFLSNVDPDDATALLKELDLSKTLVVNVSKSGTTLETLTNEEFLISSFKKAGLDPNKHIVAVTGKGSPMDDPSKYLEVFYIWDFIGGRYSVTSMVGGVSLAFALGMDRFLDFLHGASNMDKVALNPEPKANLPLLSALLGIWNRNFLGYPTVAVIPYSNALARFSAHLQQLDMESNGKSIDKHGAFVDFDTGPIIWGEIGTNSQHSFFQSIHQGTGVAPLEFIGFNTSQYKHDITVSGTTSQQKLLSNLFAQSLSLAIGQKSDNPNKTFKGNRPSRLLIGDRLDPFTAGAILSYYEHKVAFQGFIWNINSFDQEGVQLGKVLANKFLDLFIAKNKDKNTDEKEFTLGLAYLNLIEP